jgi:hypothetical protein
VLSPAERPPAPVRGVRTPVERDEDHGNKVVGFGSDVPAFLTRAPLSRKPSQIRD